MRKLLWVGDAVSPTGFERITREVIPCLQPDWDVTVLGLNYFGDPHDYPCPVYPAIRGHEGDTFGLRRLPEMLERVQPDVVFIQNDPWNIPAYLTVMKSSEYRPTAVMAGLAVDGLNCRGAGLEGLDLAVFWTQFGLREARLGGYTGNACVIPLGVDISLFDRRSKPLSRVARGLPAAASERLFIVGSVGRNQPRKRLDLTIEYFAEWIRQARVTDAWLWLHIGPTGDRGFDLDQLAAYYGIKNRLILVQSPVGVGISTNAMVETYNSFDVHVCTSMNEGWHLPTMEAMACGVPTIGPGWAALSEWPMDAMLSVPCYVRNTTHDNINAIGGVPDKVAFMNHLNDLYGDKELREDIGGRGYELARCEEFDWKTIGAMYSDAMAQALEIKLDVIKRSEVNANEAMA